MLAVVIANVELALGEHNAPLAVTEEMESIRIASSRAQNLVKQILTFSHRNDTVKAPVDLTALAAESMRLLRSTISSRVELHVTLPPEPVYIVGDASALQRVRAALYYEADG